MMEVTPYKGLSLFMPVNDEEKVKALLDESGNKQLICDDCLGSSFRVSAIIEAELELSVSQLPHKQAVLRDIKPKTISVIRVKACANCGAHHSVIEDFPIGKRKEEVSNGKICKTGESCT